MATSRLFTQICRNMPSTTNLAIKLHLGYRSLVRLSISVYEFWFCWADASNTHPVFKLSLKSLSMDVSSVVTTGLILLFFPRMIFPSYSDLYPPPDLQ